MKKLYLIIPLIILFLSGCSNSDIEIVTLKKECTKDAKDFIAKSSSVRYAEDPTYPMTQYTSVYSPELKTCLVDISRITSPLHWYYAIIDIYTEKEIASYTLDKTDEKSWTTTPLSDNYKNYNTLKNKYFPENK